MIKIVKPGQFRVELNAIAIENQVVNTLRKI